MEDLTIHLKDGRVFYTKEEIQEIANKLGDNSSFISLKVSEGGYSCFRTYDIIINKTEINTIG